jgi:hypothetical protein
MEPDSMNDQFFVCGFVLMFVAFLTSAAAIDYRRKRKTALPIGSQSSFYFNEFGQSDFPHASFDELEDLYAYNRNRLQAYQARARVAPTREGQ